MTEAQGETVIQALGVIAEYLNGGLMAFGVVCGFLLAREVVKYAQTKNFWEWGGR